jgi:hypothetical protein
MTEMTIADLGTDVLAHDVGYSWVRPRAAAGAAKGGLSRMVEDLVLNTTLSYAAIVAMVKEAHPQAETSTKSVASVACVMRKKGHDVPLRLNLIRQ